MDEQPRVSDDGRFFWDGEKWAPMPVAPSPVSTTSAWKVAIGILLAIGIIWLGYAIVHSDDEFDCTMENADRAIAGEPQKVC